MKKVNVRNVVAMGIGAALYIVLSYVVIPTGIPNTALQTRTALLAFFAAVFGPVAGAVIGLVGHTLADAFQYGSIWWSWVFPDALFGLLVGLFVNRYKIEQGDFGLKAIITFNIVQIIANAAAWIGLAPVLDILIYAEPANKVFVQGLTAFGLNIVTVGVIGSLLAYGYSKIQAKPSSLSKED